MKLGKLQTRDVFAKKTKESNVLLNPIHHNLPTWGSNQNSVQMSAQGDGELVARVNLLNRDITYFGISLRNYNLESSND